ncbi:MAG: hypothetical protein AAF385_08360 [Pseudomonadota bacterium]
MSKDRSPLILFVPGMKPKPEPHLHSAQVWRCLLEGVRRVDTQVFETLRQREGDFELCGWTHQFYNEYRDISIDLPGIEAALKKSGPDANDIKEAKSLKTRLKQWSFLLGNALPFLIPQFADADMQITLRDVRRYMRNEDNIGRSIRRNVRLPLRKAWHAKRPVLLIGHSLGSVIAWDTLWEMSRVDGVGGHLDMFMTIGSPLGQKIIKRRLKGSREHGRRRYPDNIRRWSNLAAVGELTAIDHRLSADYADMIKFGLVKNFDDYRVYSHYREGERLLVHSEYGYLLSNTAGQLIADFLRAYY